MLEDLWSKCCNSRHRVYARVFSHWDYDARLNVYNSRNYLYNTAHLRTPIILDFKPFGEMNFRQFLEPSSRFIVHEHANIFLTKYFFRGGGGGSDEVLLRQPGPRWRKSRARAGSEKRGKDIISVTVTGGGIFADVDDDDDVLIRLSSRSTSTRETLISFFYLVWLWVKKTLREKCR